MFFGTPSGSGEKWLMTGDTMINEARACGCGAVCILFARALFVCVCVYVRDCVITRVCLCPVCLVAVPVTIILGPGIRAYPPPASRSHFAPQDIMWRKRVQYEERNADRLEKNLSRQSHRKEAIPAAPREWTDEDSAALRAAVLVHGTSAWCVGVGVGEGTGYDFACSVGAMFLLRSPAVVGCAALHCLQFIVRGMHMRVRTLSLWAPVLMTFACVAVSFFSRCYVLWGMLFCIYV